MRIIAGRFKGKRLAAVQGEVRPTSDRLRESLFNVLGAAVADTVWVDAFCGTGAVGIEALSRGARLVLFNDSDPGALRILRNNLKTCEITEGLLIERFDALTLFNKLLKMRFLCDIVFLDPPYRFARYDKLLKKVKSTLGQLSDPLVILEVFKKTKCDFLDDDWELERLVVAGDSHLLFLRLKGERRPAETQTE